MRVAYCRVWDENYPRNARVRAHLTGLGDVEVDLTRRGDNRSRPRRLLQDVWRAFTRVNRRDVYILSEFSNGFAPLYWLVARLNRGAFVVDAFVGKYETEVEDWGRARPRSLKARLLRFADTIAYRLADLVLIDTDVRAAAIEEAHPGVRAMALPVGAPTWAVPAASPEPSGTLRLLYYGNYAPLHGLPVVLEALGRAVEDTPIRLTLVGDGALRPSIEKEARLLGVEALCDFRGPVPESELGDLIAGHDVVLGVFGTSRKAQTVLANKVWQGLACGKPVITQASPAIAEIVPAVGDQLVIVEDTQKCGLVDSLAAAFVQSGAESNAIPREGSARRLEQYVANRFDELGPALRRLVDRRSA
ncbi:glycosyltransferase [Leifsonia sp. NPDC056824]|uniref:glycosyltransferase n=1 Tax=Leifsonia sp. NPDC056824 TaxID=3345953 RepID=UPI0036855741